MTIPEQAVEADLVERLRKDGTSWAQPIFNEAADEIERLRKELGATQAEVVQRQDELGRLLHAAEAEIGRLRLIVGVNTTDVAQRTQDAGKIATAIGLFASAVKAGEKWSPRCETAKNEALDALTRLSAQSGSWVQRPEDVARVVRSIIAHWANTGRIQPPSGNFWATDINKFTAELTDAVLALPHTGQAGEGDR